MLDTYYTWTVSYGEILSEDDEEFTRGRLSEKEFCTRKEAEAFILGHEAGSDSQYGYELIKREFYHATR